MSALRKSWADRQAIPTGVWGEVVDVSGTPVEIREANRATVFEFRRAGIEILHKIERENYNRKGVAAVLFGVELGDDRIGYAVFVEDGFLITVTEDED